MEAVRVLEQAARGPYRNGIRRRQQIVASAAEVFGRLGYVGGSLRTIAERVGASPATLIQHFGSKEGLLTAVLEDWGDQTADAINPAHSQGLDYLRNLHQLMHFHYAHRGLLELFVTMTAEATSPTHPAHDFIQQRYARARSDWVTELRRAVDQGEVAPLADAQIDLEIRLLIAVADGLEVQWLLDPTIDLAGMFSTYLDRAILRWQTR